MEVENKCVTFKRMSKIDDFLMNYINLAILDFAILSRNLFKSCFFQMDVKNYIIKSPN